MNLNIFTSFVVGGIFLLTLLAFNNFVFNSAVETTTGVMTENSFDTIVEILQNDINRLGYNTGTADNILTMTDGRFEFKGDIYDEDGSESVADYNTVEWHLTANKATSTDNPDDYILTRTFDPDPFFSGDSEEQTFNVNHLEFKYLDANGSQTNDPELVKQISIELVHESKNSYYVSTKGAEKYYRSVWNRTIVPNNLTF